MPQKSKKREIFPALELIMSHQAIEEAIVETNSQEKRQVASLQFAH
ncbi:MAG: hypothetical protein QNJ53_19910 [Pleurocapsa sp. MO_192.B19]|nr:hypothetical protein [Pleurocapsa sp. MO_192.B19]